MGDIGGTFSDSAQRCGARRRIRLGGLAALTAVALAAAACGGNDDKASTTAASASTAASTSGTANGGGVASLTPPKLPDKAGCTATVAGSELTFGVYASSYKIDPTLVAGGLIGGSEAAALFDTLFLYDDVAKQVVPHLAEGIEANADFTEFTLKLRPNITFSDGTPLDAQMVADNFARWKAPETTAPQGGMVKQFIGGTQVVDPTTLKITMNEPWAEFPAFLSEQPGMIVNTKVAGTDRDTFAAKPADAAGVGPYVLETNSPGEPIVFKARKNYWGGPVCIETLKMVSIPGAQATYEAFQTGELDVAFTRDPEVVRDADSKGVLGYYKPNDVGMQLLLNLREGFVGHDARLREAIWLAIDPARLNQQVYGNAMNMSSSLISPDSAWASPGLATVTHDLEKAKQLVAAAKADGVDTTITILGDTTPPATDAQVAWQGMLQAAGFDVTIESQPINEKITQVFQGKFELTGWSLSIEPAEVVTRLYAGLHTGATNNRGAYSSTEMDAALTAGMSAPADQRAAAVKKINDIYVKDFVTPNLANSRDGIMWKPTVHGVVTNPTNIFLFDRAYLDG